MPRVAQYNSRDHDATLRALVGSQANMVDVTTHAVAGTLMDIEHSLGRIPIGYVLCDPPFAFIQYGRNTDDTEHTDKYLYVRFSVPSTALKLLVF